jgi:hypothetical protein
VLVLNRSGQSRGPVYCWLDTLEFES